ncbi:hypothetical protein C0Q70_00622 [Pomacea canaliculata]|uniref:Disintegrin domain-containing protein n=1 Tax=Pomacea canaliculata TaxID=400727 RepID=A0A2T7PXA6_POMCA|nr:hypothetical protein C0Q70_00622 [Pomacea canaliculata]
MTLKKGSTLNEVIARCHPTNRMQMPWLLTSVDDANLLKVVFDNCVGDMDTGFKIICWTQVYLLHHPDVQDKCGVEIHSRFSPCSIDSISPVLSSVSQRCFIESAQNEIPCGNGVVDFLEECDAGPDGLEGKDKCCSSICLLRENARCRQPLAPFAQTIVCVLEASVFPHVKCLKKSTGGPTNHASAKMFPFYLQQGECVPKEDAACGNGILDKNEECDVGESVRPEGKFSVQYVVLHKVIAMENRKLQVEENNVHKKLFHYETLKKSDISLHVRHHRDVDTGHVTARTYVTFFTLGIRRETPPFIKWNGLGRLLVR